MMKEQLSALMDSELSEAEATRLIQSMKTDHSLHEAWDTYHLLGDALRKSPQFNPNFNQQIAQRIALEPTILAPRRATATTTNTRRFPMALAASVAAVGLVGFLALQIGRLNQVEQPAQIATAPVTPQPVAQLATATPVAKPTQQTPAHVEFTKATPSTYLLAHQEYSPSYAPAYVRVVSEQVDHNR